jgi:poly(3-hydroxybutyrate) depolymerase
MMGAAGQPAPAAGMGGMSAAAGATATAGAGGSAGPTGTPTKSPGCGKAPPASDTSVKVGSGTGTYMLDMPPGYDNNKAYPLIFVWHGAGVTNTAFHDYLNIKAVAGAEAIVVTPECLNGGSSWPNDASYFDALLAQFSANYCVDTARVFTTGHSMGGMHTGLLGCLRADKLRGDAVLAAPHPTGQCVKGNMGVMMSVGDSDFVASGPTEFAWWANKNGCDANMTMPVDPKECVEYAGCEPGTPLRTCTFSGGHEIPPWVAGAVWSFFKKL